MHGRTNNGHGEAARGAAQNRGFTLIELLVVIAIIALLVSILLPSLNRAKEMARLAVCQSNLHNYGLVAHQFASEYDGFYPGALHWSVQWGTLFDGVRIGKNGLEWEDSSGTMQSYGPGYPTNGYGEFDTRSHSNLSPHPAWRAYGTSLDTYGDYGLAPGALSCPSRTEPLTAYQWGEHSWLWSDYFFVGGCESNASAYGVDSPGWIYDSAENYAWNDHPEVPPAAVSTAEGKPSGVVLGMDTVLSIPQRESTRWNHESRVSENRPGPQNLLWGDGSVTTRQDEYYQDPIDDGAGFSICSWQGGVGDKCFYWYYRE